MNHPRVLMSYAWETSEHNDWVRDLAARLRGDGVDAIIDKWQAVPGDQLPSFMESAVRSSDFVLIICTPEYKAKCDQRRGGVGYEGDLMTGEVFTGTPRRKFIPILRRSDWASAAPSWLLGTYFIDMRGSPYQDESYNTLLSTVLGTWTGPPAIGSRSITMESDLLRGNVARVEITTEGARHNLFGALLGRILVDYLGLPSLLEIHSRMTVRECLLTNRFKRIGGVGALWNAVLGGDVRCSHDGWWMRAQYQRPRHEDATEPSPVGEGFAVNLNSIQLTPFVNRNPGRYYVLPQWYAPRDMDGRPNDGYGSPDGMDSLISISSDLILVENIAVRRFGLGDVRLRPRLGRVLLNAVDVPNQGDGTTNRRAVVDYDLRRVTPRQLGCSPWFSAASPMGFPVVVSEAVFRLLQPAIQEYGSVYLDSITGVLGRTSGFQGLRNAVGTPGLALLVEDRKSVEGIRAPETPVFCSAWTAARTKEGELVSYANWLFPVGTKHYLHYLTAVQISRLNCWPKRERGC